MRIEHVAVNVSDPRAMAAWYCAHLGFTVKRQEDTPPYTHFLADGSHLKMLKDPWGFSIQLCKRGQPMV
jgi:catechol 2,3-dioxygenase-like lactoylglutathione lyase family enzyme